MTGDRFDEVAREIAQKIRAAVRAGGEHRMELVLAEELRTRDEEIARMREAVAYVRAQFEAYAVLHLDKCTEDGDRKAKIARAALSPPAPTPEGGGRPMSADMDENRLKEIERRHAEATKAQETAVVSGHGHVWPRADGVRMRCGGPSMCPDCARDLAASQPTPWQDVSDLIAALRARDEEVARLRGALRKIVGKDSYIAASANRSGRSVVRGDFAKIARAALSPPAPTPEGESGR